MLVSRQLADEIDKILPQMQEELAKETEQILASLENNIPTDAEARTLIKGEDINIVLRNEVRIWRRYYG